MPPKRIQATQDDDKVVKKLKVDDCAPVNNIVTADTKVDDKQVCWYDGNCKQKNSIHWATYRHEKQTEPKIVPVAKTTIGYASSSSSSEEYVKKPVAKPKAPLKAQPSKVVKPTAKKIIVDSSSSEEVVKKKTTTKPVLAKKPSLSKLFGNDPAQNAASQREGLVNYKNFMRYILNDVVISAEKKKMLLEIRKKEEITKEEHENLLGMFGWTTEEYEVGERDHDYDLKEELEVYKNEDGFKILNFTKDQKLTKEQQSVWDKASAKFFQTMAKAQGNYSIKSLGVIINSKLNKQFNELKKEYEERDKKLGSITWGFHGTTPVSILSIAKEGFKLPDELKKKKGKNKVELLDDGYFGNGIYFSVYSDYAMWYSEERGSDEILLSALLQGETFQCTERMDGQGLKKGYDSQISPKGNEIIVFKHAQVLPKYIIRFDENDANEREQED